MLSQGRDPQACLVNTLQEQAYVHACQAQVLFQAAVVHPELPMIPDRRGAATICGAHAPLAEQGLLCLQASITGFRRKAANNQDKRISQSFAGRLKSCGLNSCSDMAVGTALLPGIGPLAEQKPPLSAAQSSCNHSAESHAKLRSQGFGKERCLRHGTAAWGAAPKQTQ